LGREEVIADDLFAGAGGWDLAAQALGIHARGIENMPEARATRDAAGLTTIHDDVWTFEPDGRATGEIASPPCPTFSPAGKGTGRRAIDKVLQIVPLVPHMSLQQLKRSATLMDGDERTALVLTPLWFLTHYPNYRWAAWEQVPAVLPLWEACAEVLREGGWNVWTGKLHSEQYGVPQTRTRAFLLANRDTGVTPPTPTHSRYHSRTPEKLDEGVEKWVSMAEGLGWGLSGRPSPTVTGGGTETGGAEPIAKWEERWTQRPDFMSSGTRPGAVLRSVHEPSVTLAFGHDAASYTFLPAGLHVADLPQAKADGRAARITVKEAGALQSFPVDHPWQGNKGKQYLQAGNAVPPLMALHALAEATGLAIPSSVSQEEVA
jgi:DNA (cytosine-5)-methyltransferase 1